MTDADRGTLGQRFREWYRANLVDAVDAVDREEQILAVVRAVPRPSRARWSRIGALAAAASLITAVLGGWWWLRRDAAAPPAGGQDVRFVFVAPAAATVALVGDFNGWDASETPMRRGAREEPWVATITIPRERRVFTYAFIVDGTQWMPDPNAPLASTGDFGSATSVLVLRDRRRAM